MMDDFQRGLEGMEDGTDRLGYSNENFVRRLKTGTKFAALVAER